MHLPVLGVAALLLPIPIVMTDAQSLWNSIATANAKEMVSVSDRYCARHDVTSCELFRLMAGNCAATAALAGSYLQQVRSGRATFTQLHEAMEKSSGSVVAEENSAIQIAEAASPDISDAALTQQAWHQCLSILRLQ
jgi:hypothetical protein